MKKSSAEILKAILDRKIRNVQKHGVESIPKLLIVDMEELGEVARAYQEESAERFYEEVIDTAAVLLQMVTDRDIEAELKERGGEA